MKYDVLPGQIWRNNSTGLTVHILRVGGHWLCARPNDGGEVRYLSLGVFVDEYTRLTIRQDVPY